MVIIAVEWWSCWRHDWMGMSAIKTFCYSILNGKVICIDYNRYNSTFNWKWIHPSTMHRYQDQLDRSQERCIGIGGGAWVPLSVVSVAVSAAKSLKIHSQNFKILCNLTNFRESIRSVLCIGSIGSLLGIGQYWKWRIGISIGNEIVVSVHP